MAYKLTSFPHWRFCFDNLDDDSSDENNDDDESDCNMYNQHNDRKKSAADDDNNNNDDALNNPKNSFIAYVVIVEVSVWYGRNTEILELYVPDLGCSFNNSAGFLQEKGNVISCGCRGSCLNKVKLTKEQFDTLKAWRDLEYKYREELEKIRGSALNTCFGAFDNADLYRNAKRNSYKSQDLDRLNRKMIKVNEKKFKEVIYKYAGLRSPDFITSLLIQNSKKIYFSSLVIERNIRILYKRWKNKAE